LAARLELRIARKIVLDKGNIKLQISEPWLSLEGCSKVCCKSLKIRITPERLWPPFGRGVGHPAATFLVQTLVHGCKILPAPSRSGRLQKAHTSPPPGAHRVAVVRNLIFRVLR
jgi:hypothetical protein